MQTIHVHARMTRKYVGTYKHMDDHEYVGSIKITEPKIKHPHEDADMSVGNTYIHYARLPANVDKKRFLRAIEDELSSHDCHHEHDCCGCASYYARAKMINNRQVKIKVSVGYNY